MNDQNLTAPPIRSSEEAARIGRKGGIASGKARLRKKHGRELVRALLSLPETDEKVRESLRLLGIEDKDITNEVVLHARQMEKAKRKADTQAYKAINAAAGYLDEAPEYKASIVLNVSEDAKKGLEIALASGAAPRAPKDEENE